MNRLDGKVILICGGATGIGDETARRLCDEGAQVALADINAPVAQSLAQELSGNGAVVEAFSYNQAEEASIVQMVAAVLSRYGSLNGLFANVADLGTVLEDGDLLTNDLAVWERTLSVNLSGTAMVVRACLPHLLDLGGGSIVCTSSSASTVGEAERPAYAASKAGVEALCRHVSSRWGKEGVRCNAVAPGFVLTDQIRANMSEQMLQRMLKGANAPRHGEPRDIAATVSFLLSDDAEWVNGQSWHVNGGVYYGG